MGWHSSPLNFSIFFPFFPTSTHPLRPCNTHMNKPLHVFTKKWRRTIGGPSITEPSPVSTGNRHREESIRIKKSADVSVCVGVPSCPHAHMAPHPLTFCPQTPASHLLCLHFKWHVVRARAIWAIWILLLLFPPRLLRALVSPPVESWAKAVRTAHHSFWEKWKLNEPVCEQDSCCHLNLRLLLVL